MADSDYLRDGFSSALGGVDTSKNPCLLTPDQLSFTINCDMRGGFLKPRAGILNTGLVFPNDLVEDRFKSGRFQAGDYFAPDTGPQCLVASIGGRQFRINVGSDNSVQEITITNQITTTANFVPPAIGANVSVSVTTTDVLAPGSVIQVNGFDYLVLAISSPLIVVLQNVDDPGTTNPVPSGSAVVFYDPNSALIPKAWFQQAESWMILNDGSSLPWIYDGASARRSVPAAGEIRTGRMMAYGMGRLWYGLPDKRSFRAGDLVGSSSGTPALNYRDAVLHETQNTYLTNGDFFTPAVSGGITAMRFIAIPDTSFGQGPLLVFTPNQIFSINCPLDATVWQTLENPIQTISFISYGGLSQYGTILVNGDVMFRSLDGFRSYILARRDFTTWGNTPISREMDRVLKYDDSKLLGDCSEVLFNNRLLATCSPVNTQHGTYHRGWLTLDFDLISSMAGKAPPVWESLNVGLNILQLVKGDFNGVERCFAFALNYEQEVEVWELTKDEKFDHQANSQLDQPIHWVFETRAFGFGTSVFPQRRVLKNLQNLEMEIDNLIGNVNFKVYFKPDNHPCWIFWKEFSECSVYKDCDFDPLTGCQTTKEYQPQYRHRLSIGQPPSTCDTITNKQYRLGYQFQVRIEVEGYCEIKNLTVTAEPKEESLFGNKSNVVGCA